MIDLSFDNIILTKQQALKFLPVSIEYLYKIDAQLIGNKLHKIFNKLIDNLLIIVEYPYVEKYYRDSYYLYVSKKHRDYDRNCVRLSFFCGKGISKKDIGKFNDIKKLQDRYLGFLTIRPTFPNVIGYTFLSPNIIENNNFSVCSTNQEIMVYGCKLDIDGFPFFSQDIDTYTCAETTILNIMNYFGSKYGNYSTILPSQIIKILKNSSSERQLPSKGLDYDDISGVLKKLGFAPSIYSNIPKYYNLKEFKNLIFCLLESRIPIIILRLVGEQEIDSHAVVAIGRSNKTKKIKFNYNHFFQKNRIIDYYDLYDELVVMDDTRTPYHSIQFNDLNKIEARGYKNSIQAVIVPFYEKIYFEPFVYRKYFEKFIEIINEYLNEKSIELFAHNGTYAHRYFLITSNSYKSYIFESSSLPEDLKEEILKTPMPKYIWVSELYDEENLNHSIANSVIVFDATENSNHGLLIFAFHENYLITYDEDIRFLTRKFDGSSFFKFDNF